MTSKLDKVKTLSGVTFNAEGNGPPTTMHKLMSPTAAQLTLDMMIDAVISIDKNESINYLNQAAAKLSGWSVEEALGRNLHEVFYTEACSEAHDLLKTLSIVKDESEPRQLCEDFVLVRKDGHKRVIEKHQRLLLDESGQVKGSIFTFRDVTDARTKIAKILHLSQHDCLTGLANRALMQERLNQSLLLAKRHNKRLAILYLDIDLFKDINDEYGHIFGDKLLCSVGERMLKFVRDTDTVCRHGGDEFVILLSEIEHPNDVVLFSQKLKAWLASPYQINDKEISISTSIGMSIFPNDGEEDMTLLERADASMFKQKSSRQNRIKSINKQG